MFQVLYGETPGNPLLSILDLEEFGCLGQKMGIMTIVDSTLASPYCQKPVKLGVDVNIHSAYVRRVCKMYKLHYVRETL